MKSTLLKVLAITMAAGLIACAGAACTQQTSTNDNSTASVTSAESEDESKTESTEGTDSSEEESKTDDTAESEAESTDESEDEGAESEADQTAEADLTGCYEFGAGSEYEGYIFNSDGTLEYRNVNGYTISGTWEKEDDTLKVHLLGGLETFTIGEDKIVSDSTGREYLDVEALSLEDKTQEVLEAAVLGEWNCETDPEDVAFTFVLEEGGTGYYKLESGDNIAATWEIADGVLNVRAAGGLETFLYSDFNTPTLTDTTNETRIFKKVG